MSDTIPTPTWPGSPLGAGFMPVTPTASKGETTNTGKLHPDYVTALPRWTLCRDAIEGEDVVRSKGTLYLPQPGGQDDDEYTAYSNRASYTNAVGRAHSGLEGLIFRKKPTATLPPKLEALLTDITTTGMSLDELTKYVTSEVLKTARGGLLVEYPVALPIAGKSVAEAEQAGERPYLTFFVAEDILNWREGRINNKKQLTWVKLRDWIEVPGEDETKYVETIRNLYLGPDGMYYQTVGKVLDRVDIKVKGKALNYIPFVPLGATACSIQVQKSPMYDVAVKNIHHWQMSADRRNALHWGDSPTPIIEGPILGKDGQPVNVIKLGSSTAVNLAMGGKAYYLEFQGNAIVPTKDQMNEDMAEMAMLLSHILTGDSNAAEAAETAAIHRSGENSVLASMANTLSSGITKVLRMLADFLGVDGDDISYRLNTNFYPTPMSSQMFIALTNGLLARGISVEEFFEALVSGDVIRPDKTLDQHKEEIAKMPVVEVPIGGAINPPGGNDAKGNTRDPSKGDAKAQ
jgi:hypothetical protein